MPHRPVPPAGHDQKICEWRDAQPAAFRLSVRQGSAVLEIGGQQHPAAHLRASFSFRFQCLEDSFEIVHRIDQLFVGSWFATTSF